MQLAMTHLQLTYASIANPINAPSIVLNLGGWVVIALHDVGENHQPCVELTIPALYGCDKLSVRELIGTHVGEVNLFLRSHSVLVPNIGRLRWSGFIRDGSLLMEPTSRDAGIIMNSELTDRLIS